MSTTKLTLAQKVANLNTPLTWDNIQNKPPFGTEANTILEGSKFIEGLGVNGYGGTIQDPGQKVAGKCYFDINTKSLFLCKTTNNLTSPNSDYFTSFDNKSLLNKLENLIRFGTVVVTTTPISYIQTGNGKFLFSESGPIKVKQRLSLPDKAKIVSVTPVQSPGCNEYCTYDFTTDIAHAGNILPENNRKEVGISVAYILF